MIFASGGFTHDVELRRNFLSAPVFGGCAALTNEGDFVRIGDAARRPAAQHELRVDVPGPAGEGASTRDPTLVGHVLRRRRLDAVRRQARPPRRQREAAVQRARAGVLPVGPDCAASTRTSCSSRSGTSAARSTRRSDEYGRLIVGDTGASDAHVCAARPSRSSQAAVARAARARTRTSRAGPRSPTTGRRNLQASVARFNELAETRRRRATSAAASAPCSSSSTATCARSRAARTRRCGRSRTRARTTPRSSPAARWTPRAARRRRRGAGRRRHGPADPGPLRRRQLRRVAVRAAPTGRAGRRSARCIAFAYRAAQAADAEPVKGPRSRAPCHREENPRWH